MGKRSLCGHLIRILYLRDGATGFDPNGETKESGMGVSSGRSVVGDLSFQVFGRPIHPDLFTTRAFSRVARTGWEADVRIIDGGHAILWSSGQVRLAEILAGPQFESPDSGVLYQSRVRCERSTTIRQGAAIEYQTCFSVERLDSEVFGHLNQELTLDGSPHDLFYVFGRRQRLLPSPLSRIRIEARARGLSIAAFHTFPEEMAIVRTQSLFEWRS